MNGKGSAPRPFSVTPDTYAANYARIRWTDDPPGHDEREKFCPPLTDPNAKALRDQHLAEAKDAITNAPPMSPKCRATIDKAWAAYDAAYPHELSPKESQ